MLQKFYVPYFFDTYKYLLLKAIEMLLISMRVLHISKCVTHYQASLIT